MWVLGIQPRSSTRATSAFNKWAIYTSILRILEIHVFWVNFSFLCSPTTLCSIHPMGGVSCSNLFAYIISFNNYMMHFFNKWRLHSSTHCLYSGVASSEIAIFCFSWIVYIVKWALYTLDIDNGTFASAKMSIKRVVWAAGVASGWNL